MPSSTKIIGAAAALAATALVCAAQNYSIDWHKIAAGGGTSSGAAYTLSGTIGQHDAGGPMTGGPFSVTGGFWAVTALEAPGVPNLAIALNGPGSLIISWPASGNYLLQQASSVAGPWSASTNAVTASQGRNNVTITPPLGNWFFRLKQ